MDEWMTWMKSLGTAIVDPGAPLGKTKRVSALGVTDVKNDMGGYSVVQAESNEAAAKLFEGSPHLKMPGATVDVLDIVDMPGMEK